MAGVLLLVLVAGCSSRRSPAPAQTTGGAPVASGAVVQQLFEAGRHEEVVDRVSAPAGGAENVASLWLAAHSSARLGRRDEAARLFARLPAADPDPAWQVTSDLALAGLDDDGARAARARQAAGEHPDDPFVQYELGLALARAGDFGGAVRALERTIAADPAFAYAYYYAGLAYRPLDRVDLMVSRFETFVRLAPQAPERPEVESILRTVRGR